MGILGLPLLVPGLVGGREQDGPDNREGPRRWFRDELEGEVRAEGHQVVGTEVDREWNGVGAAGGTEPVTRELDERGGQIPGPSHSSGHVIRLERI